MNDDGAKLLELLAEWTKGGLGSARAKREFEHRLDMVLPDNTTPEMRRAFILALRKRLFVEEQGAKRSATNVPPKA